VKREEFDGVAYYLARNLCFDLGLQTDINRQSRLSRIVSRVDGYVEKLYVNETFTVAF